jgi:hypothetical protein
VPEHRAVLHEAVVQEHLLALLHVVRGVEHLTARRDDALRDRWLGLVGAVGEQPEDEEPEQHDERHGLNPALRHQQLSSSPVRHSASSRSPAT